MTQIFSESADSDAVNLSALVGLFYGKRPETLARFRRVAGDALPPAYAQLLDHENHMTITVEAYYGSPVDVRVVRRLESGDRYSREILLATQGDGRIVQYGIVRLRPDRLQPHVWEEVRRGDVPLGRVLIRNNVFRQVELSALWEVTAGTALAELLQLPPESTTYGRTARIYCDGEPAIELLEIVAPV